MQEPLRNCATAPRLQPSASNLQPPASSHSATHPASSLKSPASSLIISAVQQSFSSLSLPVTSTREHPAANTRLRR